MDVLTVVGTVGLGGFPCTVLGSKLAEGKGFAFHVCGCRIGPLRKQSESDSNK